jgi:sulfonate transport system substrate-binding protein
MKRRTILQLAASGIALAALPSFTRAATQAPLKELRLDYAYYSPTSLVLRRFGWLEEAFKPDGTSIKWVLSAGSNRALEYLNANSIDIGSSAGLAALLARANGNPIRAPYIFSRPEWTALVVRKDSPIRSVADLKGKKVAATKGTDPYLFLLRSLKTAGLKRSDIEHVSLQHADGRAALEQGKVDAWAGLDPHMAASELEAGSRLIYRNVAFNTYGFLNVREDFLASRPAEVGKVIQAYERARA